MSDIVICTGPSGVKIGQCLERLNAKLRQPRGIISIENRIVDLTTQSFVDFLSSPRVLLQEAWSDAAQAVIKEAISETSPVFLTFHAVYYSQRTRGFLPAVDIDRLRPLKQKVKSVLVFIDDVYDVYLRLMGKDEMFEYVRSIRPLDALTSSIINLVILLHWREMEIALSRIVADYVGAPLYVVATKHPASVFVRLVEGNAPDLRAYYLSHPITAIRREADNEIQAFVGELHHMVKELIALPNVVCFIPTTIDELAIKAEKTQHGMTFSPELAPRWSVMTRQNIIAPSLPPETRGLNPLNPCDARVDEANQPVISSLLEHLWNQVYRQTVSRDYVLVEQATNGVIAVRPFYGGQTANGVIAEVKHNLMLMKHESERSCYVISCREDRNSSVVARMFGHLPRILKTEIPDLDVALGAWLENAQVIGRMSKPQITAKLVDEVLPKGFDFQPELPYTASQWSGALAEKQDRRQAGLEELWSVAVIDEIKMAIEQAGLSHGQRIWYKQDVDESDVWQALIRFMKSVLKQQRRRVAQ